MEILETKSLKRLMFDEYEEKVRERQIGVSDDRLSCRATISSLTGATTPTSHGFPTCILVPSNHFPYYSWTNHLKI